MKSKKPNLEQLNQIDQLYGQLLDDRIGKLHNKFVGFISESKIPLYNVLVVLEILKAETTQQIMAKQGLI